MQIAVSSKMTLTFSITTSTDIAQDGDINFKKVITIYQNLM